MVTHQTDHASIALQKGIIYGPVLSRRLGRSFGINLLSSKCKICSFDCIYCEYGRTGCHTLIPPEESLPSVDEILLAVEKLLYKPRSIDCLTFSGNGEPTLHPHFLQIVQGVKQLRDDLRPGVKLAVFTNGSKLNHPAVFSAMRMVDFPMIKLDGGDPDTIAKINRPVSAVRFSDIYEGIKALPRRIVQTILIDGVASNFHGERYVALAETLQVLKPDVVHIYSIERPPAVKTIRPLAPKILAAIQKDLNERFILNVKAFWR